MSQTRSTVISQFLRDVQALRDSLIGLTNSQLSDPSFRPHTTLRAALSVIAAHYYRLGEAAAYKLGLQADQALDEDWRWQREAIEERDGWALDALQEDLEEAWEFYREMLHALSDDDLEWFVTHIEGALSRLAFETSREIGAWRLRN